MTVTRVKDIRWLLSITHSIGVVKEHSATETTVLDSQVERVTTIQICLKHHINQTLWILQGIFVLNWEPETDNLQACSLY